MTVTVDLAGEQVRAQIWWTEAAGVPLLLLDTDIAGNSEAARRSPTRSTAAIASTGCGRSSCSASAGRARWPRSASRRRSSTSTRATRPSSRSSGCASPSRTGARARRRRRDPRLDGLHHAHAGAGRQRALRLRRVAATPSGWPARPGSRGTSSATSAARRATTASGSRRSRAHRRPRERRLRAARRGRAGDVGGARRRRPDRRGHERVHFGTWIGPRLREPSPRPGSSSMRRPASSAGTARATSTGRPSPRGSRRRSGRSSSGSSRRPGSLPTRSRRLRSALCDLQARRADPLRPRAGSAAAPRRDRPVQLVVAGKAHPADAAGKELIRQRDRVRARGRGRSRVAFLPDYDMGLAKVIVRGVDIWLNTPRRPQEASGTSGMKAALNGAVNLHARRLVGGGLHAGDRLGDRRRRASRRGGAGRRRRGIALPHPRAGGRPLFAERRDWLDRVVESIAAVGERFGADRMVREYAEGYYLPAHRSR